MSDGTTKTVLMSDPMIGRLVAERYRIDAVIGQGGQGVVYKAWQIGVRRPVALKVLLESGAGADPRRFENEARALALVSHPHVVQVIDFGQLKNGRLFLVTELLDGEPLSAALRRGRLAPERARRITDQILQALVEAHSAGIVHRDLKPSNVFLVRHADGEERAKLLDFGIVRFVGTPVTGTHQQLTAVNLILGTPNYMAPEQWLGRPVDHRTDLYALGVLAYHMVTGKVPFPGDIEQNRSGHVGSVPPPLPTDVVATEQTLATFIERCLAKVPERRPADARAARELFSLPDVATTQPVAARSEQPAQRSRLHHVFALGGLLILCVALAALLWPASRVEPAPSASANEPGRLPESVPSAPTPTPLPAVASPQSAMEQSRLNAVRRTAEVEGAVAHRRGVQAEVGPVEWVVDTTPPGAFLFQGRKRLGRAPQTIVVPRYGSLDIKARRRGYRTRVITLSGDGGGPRSIRLVKRPNPAPTANDVGGGSDIDELL